MSICTFKLLLIGVLCFDNIYNAPLNDEDIRNDKDAEDFNLTGIISLRDHSILYPEENSNLYEGDIVLSLENMRNGRFGQKYRWPKRLIPYEITEGYDLKDMEVINRAMATFHKYTCVRFRPKKKSDKNYIYFTNKQEGCYSSIGNQQRGGQRVNLDSRRCLIRLGTAIHELMHAAGFWHEQNRHERDEYVTIHNQNIKDGKAGNFKKIKNDINFGQPYDYESVMHYSTLAFSKNGKPTITSKDEKKTEKLGQRKGFTRIDIAKINAMYNCTKLTKKLKLKEGRTYVVGKGQHIPKELVKYAKYVNRKYNKDKDKTHTSWQILDLCKFLNIDCLTRIQSKKH